MDNTAPYVKAFTILQENQFECNEKYIKVKAEYKIVCNKSNPKENKTFIGYLTPEKGCLASEQVFTNSCRRIKRY